jgi:hypothetical protein
MGNHSGHGPVLSSLYPAPSSMRTTSTARFFLDLGSHPLPKCQRTDAFPTQLYNVNICVIKREACFGGDDRQNLYFMSPIAVSIPAVIVTIVQPRTYGVLHSPLAPDCLYVISSSPRLLLYSYTSTMEDNLHTGNYKSPEDLTTVDSQHASPSIVRRSLSRRRSTYSTVSERCRYQRGVEKKRPVICYMCPSTGWHAR